MDGMTDFDIKFKRSLVEQLHIMNTILKQISNDLHEIRLEMEIKKERS